MEKISSGSFGQSEADAEEEQQFSVDCGEQRKTKTISNKLQLSFYMCTPQISGPAKIPDQLKHFQLIVYLQSRSGRQIGF